MVTSLEKLWNTRTVVEKVLLKAKKTRKRKKITKVGIEPEWLSAYGVVARITRDDKDLELSRYPYEQESPVGAFGGAFFMRR